MPAQQLQEQRHVHLNAERLHLPVSIWRDWPVLWRGHWPLQLQPVPEWGYLLAKRLQQSYLYLPLRLHWCHVWADHQSVSEPALSQWRHLYPTGHWLSVSVSFRFYWPDLRHSAQSMSVLAMLSGRHFICFNFSGFIL